MLAASESLKGKARFGAWCWSYRDSTAEGSLHVSAAPLSGAKAKRFVLGLHWHPRSASLSPASSISVQQIMAFQGEISNHDGQTCEDPGLN